MSVSMSDSVVELPSGARHYKSEAFADSWDAYEALLEEDGWTEHSAENIGNPETRWKEATVRGHWLVIHPPRDGDAGLAW